MHGSSNFSRAVDRTANGTASLEMRLEPNMQQTILYLNLDWHFLKSSCRSRWSSTSIVEVDLLDKLDLDS